MFAAIAAITLAGAPNPARLASWGAEAVDKFQREMYSADRGIYVESSAADAPPASLASLTEVVLALTAAASYDAKFAPLLQKSVDATAKYWNSGGPVPGFNDKPLPSTTDRSFIDNALLSVALSQAAGVLKSAKVAGDANGALNFALSGTAKLGGMFDHESDSKTHSALAGASAAIAILAHSPGTASEQAANFYEWVRQTFRDPTTNLFKASTNSNDVHAEDVGLMIVVASYLFTGSHEPKYGEQSRRLEASSLSLWSTPDGTVADTLPGAETLVESWFARLKLSPHRGEQFGATIQAYAALDWLRGKGRDRDGHYGSRWDEPAPRKRVTWHLIDQAAAARAFYVGAAAAKPKDDR